MFFHIRGFFVIFFSLNTILALFWNVWMANMTCIKLYTDTESPVINSPSSPSLCKKKFNKIYKLFKLNNIQRSFYYTRHTPHSAVQHFKFTRGRQFETWKLKPFSAKTEFSFKIFIIKKRWITVRPVFLLSQEHVPNGEKWEKSKT